MMYTHGHVLPDGTEVFRFGALSSHYRDDYDHTIQDIVAHGVKHGVKVEQDRYGRIDADDAMLIENVHVTDAKEAVSIYGPQSVHIRNVTSIGVRDGDKYSSTFAVREYDDAYAIKSITIEGVFADGLLTPMNVSSETSYRTTNKDFLTNNADRADAPDGGATPPIFLRDVTARNFSDAILDNKGSIALMNGTLENAYRLIRAWDDSETVVTNSALNLGEGAAYVWVNAPSASVTFFNTLFDGQTTLDLAHFGFNKKNFPPGTTKEEAFAATVRFVDIDPLADEPFFAPRAPLSVDISVNGGAWQTVAMDAGALAPDRSVIGDTASALPDLGKGDYALRLLGENGVPSEVLHTYQITDAGIEAALQTANVLGGTAPAFADAEIFDEALFSSYASDRWGDEDAGWQVLDEGRTVEMTGNSWAKYALGYDVTENTVLSFTFTGQSQGESRAEVQGVGFDTDDALGRDQLFQLDGSQEFGLRDFTYIGNGQAQSFTIRLGDFVDGTIDYLTFANDHDEGPADSVGRFSDIRIYELYDELHTAGPGGLLLLAPPPPDGAVSLVGLSSDASLFDFGIG